MVGPAAPRGEGIDHPLGRIAARGAWLVIPPPSTTARFRAFRRIHILLPQSVPIVPERPCGYLPVPLAFCCSAFSSSSS